MDESNISASPKEETFPMIALRGICLYPEMTMSFDVERKQSIAALEAAAEGDRKVLLLTQRDVLKEYPGPEDVYNVGVVGALRQYIRIQDGLRVIIQGLRRVRTVSVNMEGAYCTASVVPFETEKVKNTPKVEAFIRSAIHMYDEFTTMTDNAVPEAVISLTVRNDAAYTADYIAQNMRLPYTFKQELLEAADPVVRLRRVCLMLQREIEVQMVERELNDKLRERMVQHQRENILREQLHLIQDELGDDEDAEIEEYREKIAALHLKDEEIEEKLQKEVTRLSRQPYNSAEATVIRNYLDAVIALPWNSSTKERLDIQAARRALDRDHYGLDKIKDRIIEFLAVRVMAPEVKGGILCLVGPPGVGKTSIALSIAGAMNRKLARMSLGGIHDEAEIRGHRKTYIGAMPGRIMTAITQAGSKNPLLVLDEIDKLGSDYRGDPSSALLEALDPEQNTSFRDHFLEVPFDLSEVMFVTTANTTDTIPRPLLDRMEVIELSSYTDEEKLQIAKNYLLPKQRKKHGLDARRLKVSDSVIREIISGWTRESGVRQLERELAAICRKADVMLVSGEAKSLTVTCAKLESLLGVRKYKPEKLAGKDSVGVVNGLAWTSVGGEILEVEVSSVEGSGKVELTGNLGDVMKESAQAAISYIRSRSELLGIDRDFYKNRDIHIHFPEGAVPKGGPSAGITIAIAVISALTGRPVRRDIAMTGEITLTGRILPIGGLKEKTMAAFRYGVKTVIIPADNEPDLEEIDQSVRRCLNFVTTSRLDDVLSVALPTLEPAVEETRGKKRRAAKKSDGASIRQ